MNEKDEFFTYLLEHEGIQPRRIQNIAPRESFAPLSLSHAQERFWFLDQFEPHQAVYNSCKAERLIGRLDADALAECLNLIVSRHEVLRTTYEVIDGRPVQVIAPKITIAVPVLDFQSGPSSDADYEIARLATAECRRHFDLTNEPPIRAVLIRLAESVHVLLLVFHQIVFDSGSVGILFGELWTLYEARLSGAGHSLDALPVQYADFAVWQRQWLQGEALKSQLLYWKQQLKAPLAVLSLPADRPRPVLQSFNGTKLPLTLPKTLVGFLNRFSRWQGVTLFMTLLAGFEILISRYTGQEDIIVGCPVSNRSSPEIANLIGSFVNTLVLRTDLHGDPTYRETLFRVRNVCTEAYSHQDLPFEKLVEELQPQRDLARSSLFQTMFAFQNIMIPSLSRPELKSESIDVDGGIAKFDLTFSLAERNGKLVGYAEFSTDLFDRSTIERMVGHYQTLLEGIIADPDRRISELPVLTEAERHRLLVEWNDTAAHYPKDKCLHELIEAQVGNNPDAIAATYGGQRITYQELNARASQLARHLINQGVGPEKLVGICVERSLEMLVGLVGTLKAGGAYVPLDPSYPQERLAFMLEDAALSVVITEEKCLESGQLSAVSGRPTYVCIDRDWPIIQRESAENPQSKTNSENLAYAIYTSGSTGRPKGVQVSHRSVVNCLVSIGERVGLTSEDRLLAVTTISFDIAALELYLPLLVGGSVVVARREEATDGSGLARRVEDSSATIMQATPSTWRMLVEAGWAGSSGFKILCGGEPLSRELADALLKRGEVWNLYGPTETTIWSTIHKVKSAEGPISIGRPIANTQVYVLDSSLQPVPIGVHGDLYIGGDGLARGYLNRPELTDEKFAPNPFSDQPDSFLYWTGDRARYLADGDIEFHGRVDNQVKIRGHRVELGEIEAALNRHPEVKESVVVAVEDGSSDFDNPKSKIENPKSLVGYFVPKQESAPSAGELRGFLREKLPDYMIPSVFLILVELPITPNGKIDRDALPLPVGTRPDSMQEFVLPRNEIEEMVAQVWREVLKLETVGVHDNFFELGGHSLVATRVAARLRNNFGIDVALRKLFELPTVAELARHIDELLQSQNGAKAPLIVPVTRDRSIPASFSQQRLWFLRQLDPDSTAYNISLAFSVKGPLDFYVLEEAFNTVIARYEILRTTFDFVDESLVQNVRPVFRIALPVTNLEVLPANAREGKAREIALEESRKPFDLYNGPLLRAQLLRLDKENHYLLLNVDHTILDGGSMGSLFKELGVLYKAYANREPNPLSPLAVQYADYAVWQRELLQGDRLESQVEYWKRLIGSYPSLSLPADYPRPTRPSSRGVRKTLALSSRLTESLKILSRREGVTLFMTLLAAFKILLSRYSGQEDVVVGSTIAGRNRWEIEGLIGFFINALPLRTDLSGNPSFLELLKRVREVCLGAYTHQELPFEKIVEAINPSRDLNRNPFFQVMFNMADVSERVLQLSGCDVTKESFFDPEAKFDITLYAPEKDGVIELAIVYNADLFSEQRIRTTLDQFANLLTQITEKPQERIGNCSLVSPSTGDLVPDPTETLADTWEGPIHAYVADWANLAPDRIALVDANEAWTYRELETLSTQLANYLIASGIHPKDVVAIHAHRRSPLVVALLGILKAGAAFVVLDPAYPPARLAAYLRIAQPKGWVRMDTAGELPEELGDCLEALDLVCRINLPVNKRAVADLLRDKPETQTRVAVGANDPAYVAFTSGSTGEPKGVLCRHGPITHFLPWQKEAFDLRGDDRFALLSGLAYNHLHRDVFTPLAMGASLYVPSPEIAREPVALCEWLRENSITVLHLTPALGQLLLTRADNTLPAVRRIFFGGDVLTRGQVALTRQLAPNARIGSFYGATETQRAVGHYEIPENFATNEADVNWSIPLGRGIEDVQLLVFNKHGNLAGIGEIGELYVRSPHLAQGYVDDEIGTQAVFIRNPFTNDPEDRLYKTGELARYLPDGNVEWAGRNDRRVNIRGFRVELEEIEAVLKQHPTVKNAAVVLQDYEVPPVGNARPETLDPRPASCLVAYIATGEEASESLTDLLRGYLSARLPEYLVPAHFEILDHLPLSPNGKVDYRALPSVQQFLSSDSSLIQAPRNELEAKLAEIFCRVLGRERAGIEENFFRLGGHSLLAAQAAAHIRDAFGVAFELRTFLESPTIAELAKEISARIKPADTPLNADPDREEIEL